MPNGVHSKEVMKSPQSELIDRDMVQDKYVKLLVT